MKKIYLKILMIVVVVFISSYILMIMNKMKNPEYVLKKFNNIMEIKSIVKIIDEEDDMKLIFWKNEENNLIISILKSDFDLWKVIGQYGAVPTNTETIDRYVYGDLNKKYDKYNKEGIFIGYINNKSNYEVEKVIVNESEAKLIKDNEKNYIWYSWGHFEFFNKESIKIIDKYNKKLN